MGASWLIVNRLALIYPLWRVQTTIFSSKEYKALLPEQGPRRARTWANSLSSWRSASWSTLLKQPLRALKYMKRIIIWRQIADRRSNNEYQTHIGQECELQDCLAFAMPTINLPNSPITCLASWSAFSFSVASIAFLMQSRSASAKNARQLDSPEHWGLQLDFRHIPLIIPISLKNASACPFLQF